MREIKFRAWDREAKCLRYDAEAQLPFLLDNLADFDLMQYTGLKDKNGKEIYEGDIIQNLYAPYTAIYKKFAVEWKNDGYWMPDDYDSDSMWSMGFVVQNGVYGEWEVIGNIYENPELLTNN